MQTHGKQGLWTFRLAHDKCGRVRDFASTLLSCDGSKPACDQYDSCIASKGLDTLVSHQIANATVPVQTRLRAATACS